MEHFSYKGECGERKRTCIEALKEDLAWAIDIRLQGIPSVALDQKSSGLWF